MENNEPVATVDPQITTSNIPPRKGISLKSYRALVFVLIFAALGGYIIYSSFASSVTQTKVWSTAADWSAGTLSSTVVSGNSVGLAPTISTSSLGGAASSSSTNLALGRPACASSTNSGYNNGQYAASLPASAAVDGNSSTRWGSAYSDPQWIYVDLGAVYNISEVKLNWEAAYGKAYQIQVSSNANTWTTIYSTTSSTGGINDLTGLSGSGRYVRMYGTVRGTVWGYSLWEIGVYGTPVTATNLALNKPAYASSTNTSGSGQSLPASYVDDGNTSTRWGSAYSDPQWVYIDLGAVYKIGEVKLNWETAYGKAYQIQVSNDAHTWTAIYSTTSGTGGINDLTGLNGSGRYVRMYGTARGTVWGYSLWEMSVYGGSTTYVPSGNITLNYDAGSSVNWTSLTPSATLPSGTSVTYKARTSPDNTTWSAWTTYSSSSGALSFSSLAASRYIQIEADLSTTSTSASPLLNSLSLAYTTTVSNPTVTISASPNTVTAGATSTLTWSSANTTSCTASGSWSGTQATSGTFTTPSLSTAGTNTYGISCSGAGGTATASANVTVSAAVGGVGGSAAPCSSTTTSLAIHVCNGQLVNGQGKTVQLRGVDVTGTEDACIQNQGFSWGASSTPAEDSASAAAMLTWHINVVRIPLNEDCWLNINGSPAAYSGTNYQTNILNWVTALNNAGIYTILDLHWAAPGSTQATEQWPMADADHSITFWSQVAAAYKSDPAVLFDLFNEPYIGQSYPSSSNWQCWLDGCGETTADAPSAYQTAGVQQMLNAVRGAGAMQPVMVGGLNWAGNPCQSDGNSSQTCPQLSYMPTDSASPAQLVVSMHSYQQDTIACTNSTCWNNLASTMATAKLPVVTGELGDGDGRCDYVQSYMDWADTKGFSYLGWSWQAGSGVYDLVTNWSGTPNGPEGPAFKAHFLGQGDISC